MNPNFSSDDAQSIYHSNYSSESLQSPSKSSVHSNSYINGDASPVISTPIPTIRGISTPKFISKFQSNQHSSSDHSSPHRHYHSTFSSESETNVSKKFNFTPNGSNSPKSNLSNHVSNHSLGPNQTPNQNSKSYPYLNPKSHPFSVSTYKFEPNLTPNQNSPYSHFQNSNSSPDSVSNYKPGQMQTPTRNSAHSPPFSKSNPKRFSNHGSRQTYRTSEPNSEPNRNLNYSVPFFDSNQKPFGTKMKKSNQEISNLSKKRNFFIFGPILQFIFSFLNELKFSSNNAKKLLILIFLNFFYSTLELIIGLFTGKFELVSDSFHLSFGLCILIFSLSAMVWGRKKPNSRFTYGYARLEVLAAFTNSLFLLFLSFSLLIESVHAYIEDEKEHKHYLFVSAILNLCVNVLGVFYFRKFAKIKMDYQKPRDLNCHSIFLHLLSDSIRSGGIILSSVFISIGIHSAECFCLLLVSFFIFIFNFPLLKISGKFLLQMLPVGISDEILNTCIRKAANTQGVEEFLDKKFWAIVPGSVIATLSVKVKSDADEQNVLRHIHGVFNEIGITDLTVQVER